MKADALLVAEHHQKREEVKNIIGEAARAGWRTTAGPAQQSLKSDRGSNAGVACMVHGRWHSTPWADCVDAKGEIGPWFDLIGRTVNLDGIEVNIMASYFENGNLHVLQKVEHATGRGHDAFILVGDFNMSPEEFKAQADDWLRRNRAIIVRPSNLDITCRAGEKGSLIDFAVISEKLSGAVRSCTADAEVP